MSQEVLAEETLQEIIRRVVEVAHPERIILFGSAARGDMDSNSNVDLLVVKDGEYDYGSLLGDIYVNLIGINQAVDVILVTAEQVEQYRDVHCLIIKSALQEGKAVVPERYPPSDYREWLNRACNNLALTRSDSQSIAFIHN